VEVVALDAGGPRVRLVLPFVGEHEIEVAERERGQRDLGLRLDQLAAQARCFLREHEHGRDGQAVGDRLERRDPASPCNRACGRREIGVGERRSLE